jgi:hypothetical protein
MTQRALVIGAQTFGLTGVDHDVRVMAAALEKRDFRVRRCQGAWATRDGIVAEYERLIAGSTAGDVALVYYAGHGGYVRPVPGEKSEVDPVHRQFVVPTDYDPDGDEFRGITAVELSVLLRRLTDRTGNAVVILDCCHSAFLSRGLGDLRARQLPRETVADLRAHVERRLGAGQWSDLARRDGNNRAVRLVACADDQFAYEVPGPEGKGTRGLFTDALLRVWDDAGETRPSWSTLIGQVRPLVRRHAPHQRPEAAGPAQRRLFEESTDDTAGSLPVTRLGDGRVRIDGAALFGAQPGDRFVIMPGSAAGPDDGRAIATVVVENAEPVAATGRLTGQGPAPVLPPDARAFPDGAGRRVPVVVPPALADRVAAGPFIRPAQDRDVTPIRVEEGVGGALSLHDAIGPLCERREATRAATELQVIDDLNRMARAVTLIGVVDELRLAAAPDVTLEFGRVADGRLHPLRLNQAVLHTGDRVYVKVRNDGDLDLYLSLIDIGVSSAITLLTSNAPSGHKLPTGAEFVFGLNLAGRCVGRSLHWPPGISRSAARPETVLALLTAEPEDLSPIVQTGLRDLSGLGDSREIADAAEMCMLPIQFVLDPEGRPPGHD